MQVTLPDGSPLELPDGATGADAARASGGPSGVRAGPSGTGAVILVPAVERDARHRFAREIGADERAARERRRRPGACRHRRRWNALAVAALGGTILAAGGLAPSGAAHAQGPGRLAYAVDLTDDQTIDSRAQLRLEEALHEAQRRRAALLLLRLDTPGGYGDPMRRMARDIVRARLPVVVYVPSGGRAASAGLFLTLASDVAGMAPQANIGSASPVPAGFVPDRTLARKVLNDSVAFARALAENRDRNPDLAARMVRRAENVTARAAKRGDLIEVVAPSERALLAELDGFRVSGPKRQTLHTAGLRVVEHPREENVLGDDSNPAPWYLRPMGILALLLTAGAVVAAVTSLVRR